MTWLKHTSGWGKAVGTEARGQLPFLGSSATSDSAKTFQEYSPVQRRSFLRADPILSEKLSPQDWQELDDLVQEKDSELFFEQWLSFAFRQEAKDRPEVAAHLYSLLMPSANGAAQFPLPIPENIRQRAAQSLDALEGRGHSGRRSEVLLRQFTRSATDYRSIVPMMLGSAVAQFARAATLGRLATASRLTWLNTGWRAQFLAGSLSLGAEVGVFSLSERGLRQWNGEKVSWEVGALGKDLASTALTLGTFRVFGLAERQTSLLVESRLGMATLSGRITLKLIPQASQLFGMLAAHRIEEAVGLRPHVDGATAFTDALASLFSLGVGSHLGHALTGDGLANWQKRFQTSLHSMEGRPRKNNPFGPEPTFAVGAQAMTDHGSGGKPIYSPALFSVKLGEEAASSSAENWRKDLGTMKSVWRKVLEQDLGNDMTNLVATPKAFLSRKFSLASGEEVSGAMLINAYLVWRYPGSSAKAKLRELGGPAKTLEQIKTELLEYIPWNRSPETLKAAIDHVVANHFKGEPSDIFKFPNKFLFWKFQLPAPHGEVTGWKLMAAVASFEKPGIKLVDAIAELGGSSRVMNILKEKYLDVPAWNRNPETLTAAFREIIDTYFDGDAERVKAHHEGFLSRKFELKNGQTLTGMQLVGRAAHWERPDLDSKSAVSALGSLAVIALLKTKYLGLEVKTPEWKSSQEKFGETLRFIVEKNLENDAERINTTLEFSRLKFALPEGGEISGYQLLAAAAQLEYPDKTVPEAFAASGKKKKLIDLMKEKYLGKDLTPWGETEAQLQATMKYIFETQLQSDSDFFSRERFRGFLAQSFTLKSGLKISGHQIYGRFRLLKSMEPLADTSAESLEGAFEVRDRMLRDLLGIEPWNSTPELFQKNLWDAVQHYVWDEGYPPIQVNTFVNGEFRLSDGTRTSGSRFLRMVAGQMLPGLKNEQALKELGGFGGVLKKIAVEYLGVAPERFEKPRQETPPEPVLEPALENEAPVELDPPAKPPKVKKPKKTRPTKPESDLEPVAPAAPEPPRKPAEVEKPQVFKEEEDRELEELDSEDSELTGPRFYRATHRTPEEIFLGLRELIRLHFQDQPEKVVLQELKKLIYTFPDGKKAAGVTLLNHYSHERWKKDHPGEEDIGGQAAVATRGYFGGDALKALLDEIFEFRPEGKNRQTRFELTAAEGYDWHAKRRNPSLPALEAMLREILMTQFSNQHDEMTAGGIQKHYYRSPSGEMAHGNNIIFHYCRARYFKDHPGTRIKLEDIPDQAGYGPPDSIEYFLREVMGRDLAPAKPKEPSYLIASAADYGSGRSVKPEASALEAILDEIVTLQFSSDPAKVFDRVIRETTYQNPKGITFEGGPLLNRYSHARWLRDHPDQEDIGQKPAMKIPEYRPAQSLKNYLRDTWKYAEAEAVEPDFRLGEDYRLDPSELSRWSVEDFETTLQEIIRVQFNGDAADATVKSIDDSYYETSDGVPFGGRSLLRWYSAARWKRQYPDSVKKQKVICREPNYSPRESFVYFLEEVLGFRRGSDSDYRIPSLETLNWQSHSKTKKFDLTPLENILKEILQIQFHGQAEEMTGLKMIRSYYSSQRQEHIPGSRVLDHYSMARFMADYPEPGKTTIYAVLHAPGYSSFDSLRYFKEKVLSFVNFKDTSPEALQEFIRKADLSPILDLFSDDPAQLIEAISFLKGEEFKNKDITEFVKAYVGLKVEKEGGAGAKAPLQDSWEKRRLYILAIISALESGRDLDLSEENFNNQLHLLIRLSRKSFEEAPRQLIDELNHQAGLAAHSFVSRLQSEAARHFQTTLSFEVKGMRTAPYGYQREGANFLIAHPRAILADEAGMGKSYQVIAAAESAGLKRILWITTASNKETLREEILSHSFATLDQIKTVISGDPAERREQVRSLNGERYVLANYETLVALQKTDPEGYAKLTEGLDAVVVDEAQLTDNPDTLRSKAVHDILAQRRWLLTATPYQNKPENIWTLLNWIHPEKFPEAAAFKQLYTQSTQGLVLLHSELSRLMLRRTKKDTLTFFRPAAEMPFAEQLADGIPRLPVKVRVPSVQSGNYFLSEEQADLIAWMVADFRGWANYFNAHLPNGAEPISLEGINPLFKFGAIQKVIYHPEHYGLRGGNPLFPALDRIVSQRLKHGEKIILWAWNTHLLDALTRRYSQLGVRRIDGGVVGPARERARHDFQENETVRILAANYQSGGVGLTLTAAHSAIFVQLPPGFPVLYQAEGRHQRLIGPANARHAKDKVEVHWMVPRFSDSFLGGIEDQELQELLAHGTLVDQTRQRLEGGELLYNLLMEGYGSLEDLEKYFKAGVIQGMGLTRLDALDYTSHLRGEIREYAEVVKNLLPLWNLAMDHPQAQEKILHLIELFKNYPGVAAQIGAAFDGAARVHEGDLDFLISLFHLKNKFIRGKMLEQIPDLAAKSYAQGKSLSQAVEGLNLGKLTPASYLAQAYLQSGVGGAVVLDLSARLDQERDTPIKRYIEEHYFMGILGMMRNKNAEQLLEEKAPLFGAEPQLGLAAKVQAVYRIGLIARTRPDLLLGLRSANYPGFASFASELEAATQQVLGEFAGRSGEQVRAILGSNREWRGNADPLLALLAGYQELGDTPIVAQLRETLSHLLDGDYAEWRNGDASPLQGASIDYLKGANGFWRSFTEPHHTFLEHLQVEPKEIFHSLLRDYVALTQEFQQEGESVEGAWTAAELRRFRELTPEGQGEMLDLYQRHLRLLGPLLGDGQADPETESMLKKYGLPTKPGLEQKSAIEMKLNEIRNLLGWTRLDAGFRDWNQGKPVDAAVLLKALDGKVKFYRSRKYDKMAEHFEALRDKLSHHEAGTRSFDKISIEDTDNPALLARMGILHPELSNCFNPNGNPTFNQFVVGALGSKNMRLLVVRQDGKIVAAAMAKVKKLEDGTPVLFLERGLYRLGYDFRREMLRHLAAKAETLEPRPLVMDEARGKPRADDPLVLGTGAYTESEYVEPVFGIRRAKAVKHRGRIFMMETEKTAAKNAEPMDSPPIAIREGVSLLGLGTSTKQWEDYVASLLAKGVKVLVDVRANPNSQYFPQFNRKRMEAELKKSGIEYVWMGDTLGNPKNAQGQRTLQGFKDYQKTDLYKIGLARLRELIEQAEGNVALTCAEGRERECHRKEILGEFL